MILATLLGKRILLVEDELLIAMLIEETLEEAGCVVVGPFSRLGEALRAAGAEIVDAALLDVDLAGEKVYPAAELLARRGVPFLLLSGHGDKALPCDRQHWRHLGKPFNQADLLCALAGLVSAAPTQAAGAPVPTAIPTAIP